MELLEIRLGPRFLLLGRPGSMSHLLIKASDRLGLEQALRSLACDRIALRQLRSGWPGLVPATPPQGLDRIDLVNRLRRELRGGRVVAALLDPGAALPPALPTPATPAAGTFAFLRLAAVDLALAVPGRMPGSLLSLIDRTDVASELSRLRLTDPALGQLRAQAATLGLPSASNLGLVRNIVVARLRHGSLDGAVMRQPVHRTLAARVAPPAFDIGKLDTIGRIQEGVLRAEPFLRDDLAAAYAELIEPANLAIMAGVFAGLMAAQAWPPAGIAIDAAVFITAAFTIGWKSVDLFKGLVAAVTSAVEAKSEADLDAAGRHFADAFEALGAVALAALTARFSGKKFGKWMEEKQGGSAGRVAGGNRASGAVARDGMPAAVARMPKAFQEEYRAAKASNWKRPDGSTWWPPNAGTVGEPVTKSLGKDFVIDRFGPRTGSYTSPVGIPFEQRALPGLPGSAEKFSVTARGADRMLVKESEIAPWFDQPGGGKQIQLVKSDGKVMSVEEALQRGFLKVVK